MSSGNDTAPFLVTTSWDDGHPADVRLAELLAKHGAAGTFYVPNVNVEGRPVMCPAEIRVVAQLVDIGGHTRDHVSLVRLPLKDAAQQVATNKMWLEDLLGREVCCFAYVRGHHNRSVRRLVRDAGFRYARTGANLFDTPGADCHRMLTTLQFYPHEHAVYLRNYLSGGLGLRRLALLRVLLRGRGFRELLGRAAEFCHARGGCLHVWGHSWELNEYDLWDELDCFLANLSRLKAHFVTNEALWRHRATLAVPNPTLAVPGFVS